MFFLQFNKSTIKTRLTAWYILLLGCTLILFGTCLHIQLENSLLDQLDTALQVTATETFAELVEQDGHPAFKITNQSETITRQLANAGFAVWLVSPKGEIWDGIGSYQLVPPLVEIKTGYTNVTTHNTIWRVYTQPLPLSPTIGWLQVAQSLEPISEATEHLLILMLFSCPLILLVAGFGGLFLAERALRPIDRIIHTAQAIGPNDFTQRIGDRGSTDEVGRLAITIDKMLDRLQAAFEHERRFTADVSHELRTPLTVIKGRLGVTLSRSRSVEEYESTLQELQQEVNRLIRLTNRLLFLTRLEQSESDYQFSLSNVDLSDLLEILIEQIQPMAEIKNITISMSIEPSLHVVGNADHLTRLFLNLLDNAIKYTDSEGQVTVKAQGEKGHVKVIFTNTGKGIKAEHLPHLFERFYRAESDRSRDTGGSGLGLAISHEIVRLHRGTIHVTSQPDQLTNFTVKLPF
ncbi:histidine kinase [Scytonema hofmannii PCC 7110]|uniref:histidine kinase n=1 Tax=Scytonema hofmannii PCC 7110 TaxID=128403 RepID=A0A139XDP8_9CYAN|nr:ATP-binding protein [Scytonema hofmannii]KYC42824.1 histidine kinase [Scytonema hofmannii PCC 7110]